MKYASIRYVKLVLIYFRLWAKMLTADVKSKVNGDTKLAKILTPTYDIGCKRILMLNDYVPMFANKPNAHLITDGIDEITENGIKTKNSNGQEIEVDLIVLCTGFKIEDSICGFEIIGQNDTNLRQYFDEHPVAFNGITVPNFPNFFILLGPNTVLAHRFVYIFLLLLEHYMFRTILI